MEDIDKYKKFIDELASMAGSVTAEKIRSSQKFFTGEVENDRYNEEIYSLTADQQAIIANLLDMSRSSGIHDMLVFLESGNYSLMKDGRPLPHQPFGTQSFYDFVCRKEGDEWPEA